MARSSRTQHGLEPMSVFCCGCSLDTGIKVILLLHSLQCAAYTILAILHCFLNVGTLGDITFWTEAYNAGFALATVPFICCGVLGVKYRNELHLRLYLGWLMLTCALDSIFVAIMLSRSVCTNVPAFLEARGGAFMCGLARIQGIFMILLMLGFSAYAIYTVWSRCEQLRYGLSEDNFQDLFNAKAYEEERKLARLRFGILGIGPASGAGEPVIYGSMSSPIVGGSVPIFGMRHNVREGSFADLKVGEPDAGTARAPF